MIMLTMFSAASQCVIKRDYYTIYNRFFMTGMGIIKSIKSQSFSHPGSGIKHKKENEKRGSDDIFFLLFMGRRGVLARFG